MSEASFEQIFFDQLHIPSRLMSSYTSLGINEKEMMVLLQLMHYFQHKNDFPTPRQIAEYMTIEEKECANILRKLVQKGLISIEQQENNDHQISESYSLEPLFHKLYTQEAVKEEDSTEVKAAQEEGNLFILFEQEFGRPLSPFEIETINTWLDEDKIAPALIKTGLREAVLMGKLNFKYIDRILREWKKKGIRTVQQAQDTAKGFHHHQTKNEEKEKRTKKRDTSFYFNWLEGEDDVK